MQEAEYVKTHYLDASVLIKLLLDIEEEKFGQKSLRNYFNSQTNFCTTSICFYETLRALKAKYLRDKISQSEYLKASEKLLIWVFGNKVELDDVNIATPQVFKEVKRLVQCYTLDISDALQIVTLLKGKYSYMCLGSKSILITADKNFANAAIKEGVRVWYCIDEPQPE